MQKKKHFIVNHCYFWSFSHLSAVSPGWGSTSAPSTPWSSTSSWTGRQTLARPSFLEQGPELWRESACCHSLSSRHVSRYVALDLSSSRPPIVFFSAKQMLALAQYYSFLVSSLKMLTIVLQSSPLRLSWKASASSRAAVSPSLRLQLVLLF